MKVRLNMDVRSLYGENAFVIMGEFRRLAEESEEWTEDEINEVISEAMSGDYENLLKTIFQYGKVG